MRTLPVAALLAAALLAPLLAAADPAPATGLLRMHANDGSAEGWSAEGDAVLRSSPFSLSIASSGPEGVVRSPSLPPGTQTVVLSLIYPVWSVPPATIVARDATGAALVEAQIRRAGVCVGTTCSGIDPLQIDRTHVEIRIAEDGWSIAHEEKVVASGTEALGAIDHVAIRGGQWFQVTDLRAYAASGFVDEAMTFGIGAFRGDRLSVWPRLHYGPPWTSGHDQGTRIETRPEELRAYLSTPVPEGRWYVEELVLVTQYVGPGYGPNGYALLAGLDADGDALWSVGLDMPGVFFNGNVWMATLREGSATRALGDVETAVPGGQWRKTFAAIGDPATSTLMLRFGDRLVGPIEVASLASTASLAIGDVDALPTLSPHGTVQDGSGAAYHQHVVVASAAPGITL